MMAPPDSTLANTEQRIADLERQLAEREAELPSAKPSATITTTGNRDHRGAPGH
jgi:hypothetical protein